MPRKAKETNEKKENKVSTNKKETKNQKTKTNKSETVKAGITSKIKATIKAKLEATSKASEKNKTKKVEKEIAKKDAPKKEEKTKTKNTTERKSTAKTKKETPAKVEKEVSSKGEKNVAQKTQKKAQAKNETKSSLKEQPTVKNFSTEYYDLPYKYNQTVVKILAQTPTNLFIYWEISDEDRAQLQNQYGKYFFEITKPVLIIHNKTMNYTFEIDINDFANSWYIKVNDSNCEYVVSLGRRPIPINYSYMPQYDEKKDGPIQPVEISYIHISASNELSSPNDHILFNNQNTIYFRNIKNNKIIEKNITDFPFINKDSKFVSIYELYKDLYKEELENSSFDLISHSFVNPSSLGISSKFK